VEPLQYTRADLQPTIVTAGMKINEKKKRKRIKK